MEYTAAVLTVSDKGFQGLREDRSGPAIQELLEKDGWTVTARAMVPDDYEAIRGQLIDWCEEERVCLIATTGGTGFSKRDITPEATLSVVERAAPGIPEAMRAESMRITPRGMLSREAAGIRGDTLIINLPGSEKAVRECLGAVLPGLKHGVEMLRGVGSEHNEGGHHHHG